jgi:hypothetical protein
MCESSTLFCAILIVGINRKERRVLVEKQYKIIGIWNQ